MSTDRKNIERFRITGVTRLKTAIWTTRQSRLFFNSFAFTPNALHFNLELPSIRNGYWLITCFGFFRVQSRVYKWGGWTWYRSRTTLNALRTARDHASSAACRGWVCDVCHIHKSKNKIPVSCFIIHLLFTAYSYLYLIDTTFDLCQCFGRNQQARFHVRLRSLRTIVKYIVRWNRSVKFINSEPCTQF